MPSEEYVQGLLDAASRLEGFTNETWHHEGEGRDAHFVCKHGVKIDPHDATEFLDHVKSAHDKAISDWLAGTMLHGLRYGITGRIWKQVEE